MTASRTVNLPAGLLDLEGIGANYETTQVVGYVEENFNSFTKQYVQFYGLVEEGNSIDDKNKQHPIVAYSGEFYPDTKAFYGSVGSKNGN